MLELRLLDGLQVVADGTPVELPADLRARELLARLALAPGSHGRSALAGRLRPDVGEESARKTLRSALYELRRALGPHAGALVADARQIALAADVAVDVRRFRRLLDAGDLEAAVHAGRGELLAGLDTEWALRARDEHAAAFAGALAALARRAEDAGDLPAAIVWARRRVEAEGLAEDAHRELVRLLAAHGDRPAALAAAATLADRLRLELGLAPSAVTRALVEDVRRGAVAPAAAAAPAAALPRALSARAAAEPAGRAAELAALEAHAGGDGLRVALVTGEAGIGKTTVAAALARRAHAAGAVVLLGRSDEEALLPFQPWVEALEGLLTALPEAEAAHRLAAHDGALARLLPARSAGGAPPAGPRERYLAFEAVTALLAAEAARRPLVLVLDDVHWADDDALALLRHVAGTSPDGRLLVLLCARPGATAMALATDLDRRAPLLRLPLEALDDDAVAEVVAARRGPAARAEVRRLRERSGGNPLFLGELLRAGEALDTPPAPVRDVIARRLHRLGPETREALEVAAVCGVAFDVPAVAAITGRPVLDVLEALDAAVADAVVVPCGDDGAHRFAHALIAEAVVAELPPSRRARLHLRAAETLQAGPSGRPARAADVVRHLRAAGPLADRAALVRWEVAAGHEAATALAHAEAAAHLGAALAATPPDAPDRGGLLLALGHAQERAGRREAARAAFAAAAGAARAAGDAGLLARAALAHGGVQVVVTAEDPVTRGLLEEALAAVPDGDVRTASRLRGRLAVELYYPDRARARELSAGALRAARTTGDPATVAAAANARRVALWTPHDAGERLAVADELVAAARAAGDAELELQGRNWRVVDLLEHGRVAEATAEVAAYAVLADEVGLPHFAWYVPLWRAGLAQLAGRWEAARALAARALELGRRAGDPNAALFVGIHHEQELLLCRRFADIDRDRLVRGSRTSPAAAEWLVWVALLDAELGRTASARRLVRELSADGCAALGMDANWHGLCVLADAAVALRDEEAAAQLHAALEPHAGLWPVIARGIATLGPAEVPLARLELLLGRPDVAAARLHRAVAACEAAGAAPHAAIARGWLAEALGATGDPQAAAARRDATGRALALGIAA